MSSCTDFPFSPLSFPPASLLPRAAFSATAGPYKAVYLSPVDDKKVELKMKKKNEKAGGFWLQKYRHLFFFLQK